MALKGEREISADGMEENPPVQDMFVDLVSAAVVDLPLGKFHPRPCLKSVVHQIETPRFPMIDYHNHVDSQKPDDLLPIMGACGVEFLVNITMRLGEEALDGMDRLRRASPGRFSTIGWMDWRSVTHDDFVQRSCERLEQMAEHGACGLKIWKDLGLSARGAEGALLRIDDERLAPIFDMAAQLNFSVMFHTADPDMFFQPIDARNTRYEELAAHSDWGFDGSFYGKRTLLEQRNRVIEWHPETTFVGTDLAESGEDLQYLSGLLDAHPNLHVDISARTPELGQQPFSAWSFVMKYADRILFGTDLLPEVSMYSLYYRFLEMAGELFKYLTHASRQGRWNIYGIFLSEDVLKKIYRDNAAKLLGSVL